LKKLINKNEVNLTNPPFFLEVKFSMKIKKFIVKNGLIIIMLGVVIFSGVNAFLEAKNTVENEINMIELSKNMCREELKKENLKEEYKRMCIAQLEYNTENLKNFYILVSQSFAHNFSKWNFYILFVVIIPISFLVCSKLKYNYLKNYLTRNTFKKFKKELFQDAYKSTVIFPITLIVVLIMCAIFCSNFLPDAVPNLRRWLPSTTKNPIIFSILYIVNIFCYSITYANLFLISARKNHNPIIAVLVTFLMGIVIQLFFEIIISSYISMKIFNSGFGLMFNLFNSITFNDQFGVIYTIGFALLWTVLSTFLVQILYKEQEKLLIDCEKNK